MISTRVVIVVHANYVQTCVRFYGDTSLTYNELARFGADVPKAVFETTDNDSLTATLADWVDEKYDVTKPYFPDFKGVLEIHYTLPDPTDHGDFFVSYANYVEVKRGSHSIRGAFQNVKFKRAIMLNVMNAIESKDAEKLKTVIEALITVGG